MANNRMWLLHKPTGLAIRLVKRMAAGYYGVPEDMTELMQRFFDRTELQPGGFDQYCLAFESLSDKPPAGAVDWKFGYTHPETGNWADPDGIQKFGGGGKPTTPRKSTSAPE